jgi:outer membrane immunogenic protein
VLRFDHQYFGAAVLGAIHRGKRMLDRIALACVLALACAPAAAGEAGAWDWSGFYLGGHLGVGSLDTEFRSDFDLIPSDNYQSTPKSGGIHVGYGRMFGPMYLGIEGDVGAYGDTEVGEFSTSVSDGAAGSGSGGVTGGIIGSGVGPIIGAGVGGVVGGLPGGVVGGFPGGRLFSETELAESFETRTRSIASLKARVGYPVGRLLPFVSAGAAAGDVETRYLATTTKRIVRDDGAVLREETEGHLVDDREAMFGYTLGGGLEYAINSRVSIRGEYVFTDLGTRIYEHADGTGSESFKTRLHEGRIGLSFHF